MEKRAFELIVGIGGPLVVPIEDRDRETRQATRGDTTRLARTSELTGLALDVAVALCEEVDPLAACLFHGDGHYNYSTSWRVGGPVLEREGITLDRNPDSEEPWVAQAWDANGNEEAMESGKTPLVAAMRCYVARELGSEVALPAGCFAS